MEFISKLKHKTLLTPNNDALPSHIFKHSPPTPFALQHSVWSRPSKMKENDASFLKKTPISYQPSREPLVEIHCDMLTQCRTLPRRWAVDWRRTSSKCSPGRRVVSYSIRACLVASRSKKPLQTKRDKIQNQKAYKSYHRLLQLLLWRKVSWPRNHYSPSRKAYIV